MSKTKDLMAKWLLLKEQEEAANKKRLDVEVELYKEVMQKIEIPREGTTHFEDDGFKLTLVSKLNVSVDQEKAIENPELFAVKYEFSKTHNKKLTPDQLDLQGDMITIKPSKPSFKVTVL